MDSQELSSKLNQHLPRKEKMGLITMFLSENRDRLPDEEFSSFLVRYVSMAAEEYAESPVTDNASEYTFAALLLCKSLTRMRRTWECTPLTEATMNILKQSPDSEETRGWKFDTWKTMAEVFSDNYRFQQSLDCFEEALSYAPASAAFDAEDFFYKMIRAADSLGADKRHQVKELMHKHWKTDRREINRLFEETSRRGIKTDPVENSAEYLKIKDELDRKLYYATLKFPQGMGSCFHYWHEKERILREDYDIEWNSPAALNPHVMFD